jgi:hypothetical protein
VAEIRAEIAAIGLKIILFGLLDCSDARLMLTEIDFTIWHEGASLLMYLVVSVLLRCIVNIIRRHSGDSLFGFAESRTEE